MISTHNEIMSFSQEEFDQLLNRHLKKHGIAFASVNKSISWVKSSSVSPLSKSIVPVNPGDSKAIESGVKSRMGSPSYAEELKDEIRDFIQ